MTKIQRIFQRVFLLVGCLTVLRYKVIREHRKVLKHYRMMGKDHIWVQISVTQRAGGICYKT